MGLLLLQVKAKEEGENYMKRMLFVVTTFVCLLLSLSGCSTIGEKMASISVIYAVTTALSLLLLIGYCCLVHKREIWFLLLFSLVFIVNAGYLTLSLSGTLEEALLANRIAYLGSVFLPLSMLMIILDVCKIRYRKWLPGLLVGISVLVLLVAASPGYLNIYYKEVSLQVVDGMSVLVKEYGPWHKLYPFYLFSYFGTMLAVIVYASLKKKIQSNKHAIILLIAVFVNICVWLLEQLVKIEFEFLSVSYIISELFLLSLYWMMQEWAALPSPVKESEPPTQEAAFAPPVSNCPQESPSACDAGKTTDEAIPVLTDEFSAQRESFQKQIKKLTPTERMIFDLYLSGKSTREIMRALSITENTLKYHNKNIYGKLGVSSRKQLLEITAELKIHT